jgi:MtN3 and saliva related transmembrane protein
MSILSVLAAMSSTAMFFVALPQIYKIFKRKSAKDISAISYTGFTLGALVWILYGIELGSGTVIFSNVLSAATSIGVLVGWFMYGRH